MYGSDWGEVAIQISWFDLLGVAAETGLEEAVNDESFLEELGAELLAEEPEDEFER